MDDDGNTMIELGVRLTNGKLDTTIRLPLHATEDERHRVINAWFALIDEAVKIMGTRKEKP